MGKEKIILTGDRPTGRHHIGRPLLKKKRFGDPRRDTVVSEPVADGLSMLDQLKI